MTVAGTLKLTVRIEGANEVLRAFRQLPKDASNELRTETLEVSRELAERIRAAGTAFSRQAARAARTVKAVRDRTPAVQASNTGRARGFLFASEFGMNRKTGWYRKPRYFDSRALQFQENLSGGRGGGGHSYWFFTTAEDNQDWMATQWLGVADRVVEKWSA